MPLHNWTQTPPWQHSLFAADPQVTLGGSSDLWKHIQNGNVEEGMTKEQVKLSWGKPVRIEASGSVWIYGSKKLSFDGNRLHSVETVAESFGEDKSVK
jgi:hypothetical protein